MIRKLSPIDLAPLSGDEVLASIKAFQRAQRIATFKMLNTLERAPVVYPAQKKDLAWCRSVLHRMRRPWRGSVHMGVHSLVNEIRYEILQGMRQARNKAEAEEKAREEAERTLRALREGPTPEELAAAEAENAAEEAAADAANEAAEALAESQLANSYEEELARKETPETPEEPAGPTRPGLWEGDGTL